MSGPDRLTHLIQELGSRRAGGWSAAARKLLYATCSRSQAAHDAPLAHSVLRADGPAILPKRRHNQEVRKRPAGVLLVSRRIAPQGAAPLRPYDSPPFATRGFSARRSLLATFHHSPFAIRHSLSFTIRHPPLATRCAPLAVFHDSLFAIRHSPYFPFAIRRIFPLAARSSPRAVGVHKRRLADASADCRGTARRAPTLCLPTGRCARAAWPFAAGDGPPARCRRHNTTGAGLGPAPTSTSTIHHSPFAIRYSPFAVFFYSPFAVFHHPPLATRYSLRAARRLSPFAIRDSPFAVFSARCSPSFSTRTVCPRRRRRPGYVPVYRRHKVWSQDRNASGCARLTSTQSFPYRALQSFD
jgi:hypothetical protein